MKYIYCFITACLLITKSFSQIVTIDSKQTTVKYLQAPTGSITFPVELTVNYNGIGVPAAHTLSFTTANSTNTALVANGQILTAIPATIPAADFSPTVKSKKITVNVTMNATNSLSSGESFDIVLSGAAPNDPHHRVLIDNNSLPSGISVADSAKKKESIWNNITFLNAANFDFTGTVSGSYLGKLNIFAPDIKGSPWGFIAGIVRTKYTYKDSSDATYNVDNKLIHPLDSVKQGSKYLRQFNKYTSTRSNTVWSFYAQPMMRVATFPWGKRGRDSQSKYRSNSIVPNGIYLHLHGELFVNRANISTSIETIQQDTSFIDTSKRSSYLNYLPSPLIFDHTYLNGYFGIGLTFNVDPFSNGNSRFFFQFTTGLTTDIPNWTNQDIYSTNVTVVRTRSGTSVLQYGRVENKSRFFYLLRAEFTQMLSSNSQLIIGYDSRGLAKYNPLYSAYVGLNINLDALAKIFSDKKE